MLNSENNQWRQEIRSTTCRESCAKIRYTNNTETSNLPLNKFKL